MGELLFDDVVWVNEHARSTTRGALRARSVEVLYLQELLAQTLELPAKG